MLHCHRLKGRVAWIRKKFSLLWVNPNPPTLCDFVAKFTNLPKNGAKKQTKKQNSCNQTGFFFKFWVFSQHLTPLAEIQREVSKFKFMFSLSTASLSRFWFLLRFCPAPYLLPDLVTSCIPCTLTNLTHKDTFEIWECVRPLFLLTQSSWPQGVEGLYTGLTHPTQTHTHTLAADHIRGGPFLPESTGLWINILFWIKCFPYLLFFPSRLQVELVWNQKSYVHSFEGKRWCRGGMLGTGIENSLSE